ncbi:MAG: hypothetical protein J7L78_00590 [Dehalococcoidales bacterium]|nr:hypothetical protein [Dehalococcoidales bacterium]
MGKILLVPLMLLGFAVMAAIPGALIGLITGLFGFQLIAAIVGGILFFFTYHVLVEDGVLNLMH